jgi:hypothetical protein
VSVLGKIARASYQAHRMERAVRNPGQYAKNRAIAKGMGRLGFWGFWRRMWS